MIWTIYCKLQPTDLCGSLLCGKMPYYVYYATFRLMFFFIFCSTEIWFTIPKASNCSYNGLLSSTSSETIWNCSSSLPTWWPKLWLKYTGTDDCSVSSRRFTVVPKQTVALKFHKVLLKIQNVSFWNPAIHSVARIRNRCTNEQSHQQRLQKLTLLVVRDLSPVCHPFVFTDLFL